MLCKKSFVLDLTLIVLLLYLVYVFLNPDFRQDPTYFPLSRIKKAKNFIWIEHEVKYKPPDYRSFKCIATRYETARKTSLVSHFNNFQLYDLKIALSSALYKSEDYVGEIIIVDDASNEEIISEEAQEYFDELLVPVTLIRNEGQLGMAKSVKKALGEAKFENIVILDPSVICSLGWLPPLLEELSKSPRAIVLPHFDKVSDTAAGRYERVDDDYIASVLWNLQTVLVRSNVSIQASPGMRPDLFAAKRSFLQSIGSVDEGFGYGGGEALELAIRTWCCGGSIKVVSCSRVAIANFHNPVKISSGVNLRRIVGLWFQNDSGISLPLSRNFQPSGRESQSISSRRRLFTSLNCNNAQWYFREILKKRIDLSTQAARFGNLKSKSGVCAEVAPDLKINMVPCDSFAKDENLFQLTLDKHLLATGKCLTAKMFSYVTLEECTDDQNQMWEFNHEMELFNVGTGSCATHVTDPDQPSTFRQLVMAQNCFQQEKENERFKQWTFIPI